MKKTNYHTHCTFCDGKENAEAMLQAAIDMEFDVLGFSSHAMHPFSDGWHIKTQDYAAYCSEINRLKANYKDKIEVLLGFEADYIHGLCKPDFEIYKDFKPDFILGSIHFVPGADGFFEADGKPEKTKESIQKNFAGNAKEAVCRYFELEREMLEKSSFTILGHADLIRMQNRNKGQELFCENEAWYKEQLQETAKKIAQAGVIVEINTGGMARGFLSEPYPSPYFLSLLHDYGIPITIDSDAHISKNLDFAFAESIKYAKNAGYSELAYISGGEIHFQPITL